MVAVEVGPQQYFDFQNISPYHVFIRRARDVAPAGFAVADELIPPWGTKISRLPGDDYYIAYYADPKYAAADAFNPLGLVPRFSFTADVVQPQAATSIVGQVGTTQSQPSLVKPLNFPVLVAGTPTVVWTPTAGKRIRLMRFAVYSSAQGVISLTDGISGQLLAFTAVNAAQSTPFYDMGNGVLSGIDSPVLMTVGSTGAYYGMVMGTEE